MTRSWEDMEKKFGSTAFSKKQLHDSGTSKYHFLKVNKPALKNEQTHMRIRIIPSINALGEMDDFFVKVFKHGVNINGAFKPFVCLDDHDNPNANTTCPLCILKKELSRHSEYKRFVRDLNVRERHLCNVISEPFEQHLEGDPWTFIWDFSASVRNDLWGIMQTKKTMLDDLETGRDLNFICKRIGKERTDIRYSVTDFDPSPLPEEFHILTQNNDLANLAKPSPIDQLLEAAAALDPRPANRAGSISRPTTSNDFLDGNAMGVKPPQSKPTTKQKLSYSYACDGDVKGHSVTVAQVVDFIEAEPNADHQIWNDTFADWAIASEVDAVAKELLKRAATAPPPPPTHTPRPPSAPPAPPVKAKAQGTAKKPKPPAPPKALAGNALPF